MNTTTNELKATDVIFTAIEVQDRLTALTVNCSDSKREALLLNVKNRIAKNEKFIKFSDSQRSILANYLLINNVTLDEFMTLSNAKMIDEIRMITVAIDTKNVSYTMSRTDKAIKRAISATSHNAAFEDIRTYTSVDSKKCAASHFRNVLSAFSFFKLLKRVDCKANNFVISASQQARYDSDKSIYDLVN